ncbi:serine/threonine-protein kinase [Piscinibacter sakaiensis]|uniref:serine/threonine-protein kinase n=1 Tax=Piscinibacter sakaiensis TaxID=1547922 RepID=UPI003AAAA5DF
MEHPTQLGKYPIKGVIGEGAMGVVYRAFDPGIGREVALKTVHAKLLEGEEGSLEQAADGMAARFRNEARAVGRLSHPGIVAIYEYGEDRGTAFIAMEYVEGKSLAQLLRSNPPLPEAEILRLMDQLLDALGCAHEHGVWHRDIKPANLLVTSSGRIKVTDFGIARIENAGLTLINSQIGTPGYMAPEQYTGEGVDHRSDLYAAGVLLYRLLTGRKPFEGGAASVMFKVMNEAPEPPSRVVVGTRVDGYDEIIARALARDPASRFASAAEFRAALAKRLEPTLAPGATVTDIPTLVQRIPAVEASRPAAADIPATGSGSQAPTSAGSGAGSGSTALAPTGWDADLLAPIERALASVVGPMARVMVRRAARQAQDLAGVCETLAAQIDNPADRARFLSRLEGGTTLTTRPTTLDAARQPGDPTQARREIADDVKAHAIRVLTPHVGPIARILVKRAAAGAIDEQHFYESLADLADSVDRARLLGELQAPR